MQGPLAPAMPAGRNRIPRRLPVRTAHLQEGHPHSRGEPPFDSEEAQAEARQPMEQGEGGTP